MGIKIRHLIGLYLVEPHFYDGFLTEKKDKYQDRLDPNKQIEGFLAELLSDSSESRIKILDIGAGPITKVGYKLDDKQVELHPIDPLAKVYDRILRKKKIHPPVKTKHGNVEKLSKSYGKNEFDLIYANNSIDHTANPLKAIYEIFYVLKPNHYFYFSHFINEGEINNYYGLHQWNFYCINDKLFLSNRTKNIVLNISEEFRHMFDIELTTFKRRITAKFRKIEKITAAEPTSLYI